MANVISATQAHYQDKLSKDVSFKARLAQHLMNYALTVMGEAQATPNHAPRAKLAKTVIENGSEFVVNTAAAVIVNHANVSASITIADGIVTTSVTDASLLATVTAMWNTLALVESGT